jgi:hypothetical protein
MLILECSQRCYGRKEGRTDGSVTISLRNFVGEGIIKNYKNIEKKKECKAHNEDQHNGAPNY